MDETWLERNWYLVIPLIAGIGAWLIARRRQTAHPFRWGVGLFLVGCLIVLAIDLAPYLGQ